MSYQSFFLTLSLAVLIGTITDKTTGQPLENVTVTTTTGSHTFQTHTDQAGHFVLRGVADGTYTLHVSSNDVPAQAVKVSVRGASTHVKLTACSMTLDYTCGGNSGGG